jgi:cell division protein ZipA
MEDVLRWSLLVVGSCVIAGVLAHGLWVSRKNGNKSGDAEINVKRSSGKPEYQPVNLADEPEALDMVTSTVIDINIEQDGEPDVRQPFFSKNTFSINPSGNNETQTEDSFDELGLGPVRVVSPAAVDVEQQGVLATSATLGETANEVTDEQSQVTVSTKAIPKIEEPKMYASVVTQPKPEYTATYPSSAQKVRAATVKPMQNNGINQPLTDSDVPEPPASLLKKPSPSSTETQTKSAVASIETTIKQATEKTSLADQAINLVKHKRAQSDGAKRKEPKFADDQLRIDFDQNQVNEGAQRNEATGSGNEQQAVPVEIKQEVLVLNVKTPDDKPVAGSALLPMLLTLGFKFGDQDIFHRHVNSNGKGPVLFSLANMFKPGNFDIDSLENFTTQGVSLFMILPIEGDPHQVFNMMHNAARKIADEFDAQILDGRRSLLTKQSLQQYVEKIREFERQRAIHGK